MGNFNFTNVKRLHIEFWLHRCSKRKYSIIIIELKIILLFDF